MSRSSRILLAALVLLSSACKNDLDRIAAIDVAESGADRVTNDAEYFYSESGRLSNRLRAGKVMEYMAKGQERTEITDGLELVFFDSTGAPGSVLTARRGKIWTHRQLMQVDEHVVFTNVKGERLETEQLIWSQDSNRVFTDKPVRIARANDVIFGQGLDASEDFTSYTIRNVTGQIHIDPADTLAPR